MKNKILFKKQNNGAGGRMRDSKILGFSLIEIMVSMSIFAIVAVVAGGAFLTIISANKKAQSAKTVLNNMNYAIESMSSEIRYGKNYYCFNGSSLKSSPSATNHINGGYNSDTGCDAIAFDFKLASSNQWYRYFYLYDDVNGQIKKGSKPCSVSNGKCGVVNIKGDEFSAITSSNAKITKAGFDVYNNISKYDPLSDLGVSYNNSYVKVYVSGVAGDKEKLQTEFTVQTMITGRSTSDVTAAP